MLPPLAARLDLAARLPRAARSALATRLPVVAVAAVVLAGLAACGGAAPPAAPAAAAPTTTAARTSTAAPSATPTPAASSPARTTIALAHSDAFAGTGYGQGTDLQSASGPTIGVCGKQLDIDRLATTHTRAARQWTSPQYVLTHTVHAYAPGSVNEGVNQIKAAAASCTTYDATGRTYTVESATTPPYYGIDAAFTYCEQATGQSTCTLTFAYSALLAVFTVQGQGSTSDTRAELERLASIPTGAIQLA